MSIFTKLTDNPLWYIGTSGSDLGDRSFCLLLRNPLDDLQGRNDRARIKQYRKNNPDQNQAS